MFQSERKDQGGGGPRQLAERWPGLASLPHIPLADLPTAVEPVALTGSGPPIYVKRDDRTHPVYGGNKVRKLEMLLGEARRRGADALITTGALGSHHVLATSIFGAREGFAVHAVLAPQPFTDHVEENLRADLAAGATLYPARSRSAVAARMVEVAARVRWGGRHPYLIGPGGSSPVGAVAFVEAGLELAVQIDEGILPEPRAI